MWEFLKKNWLCLVFMAMLVYITYQAQAKITKYEKKIEAFEKQVDSLNYKAKLYIKRINELSNVGDVIDDKIDSLKKDVNDKIKYVDTMSVSDLQDFFTKRYPKKVRDSI